MREHSPNPCVRSHRPGSLLAAAGTIVLLLIGCALAVLGLALVLDVLSLRDLLARYGPGPLGHLVYVARAHLDHTGAQGGEALALLAGLMLTCVCARYFAVSRRSS